jgi:hypothetical protein
MKSLLEQEVARKGNDYDWDEIAFDRDVDELPTNIPSEKSIRSVPKT